MSVELSQPCPKCATPIAMFPGYPLWCPKCGWSVEPQRPKAPSSIAEEAGARMSTWMGASVLGDVEGGRRAYGLFRLATYAYASLAYVLLLACFVGGAALIVLPWLNPFALVAGIVLLGIGYVAFPRPLDEPEVVDRAEFPALYRLADEVASDLGAHAVDGIAVDGSFNASFGRYGWRGRRIMTIGLPLFTVLDGQERVAVVAHEIAHDVNRDPARSMFVGGAVRTLVELYSFFLPQEASAGVEYRGRNSEVAMVGIAGHIANAVLALVGYLVKPLLWVFFVLMQRDSQRAEYLADALAADVAGDEPARTTLRKLHLAGVFDNLARGAVAQGEQADILGALRRWVADAPPSEWERVERVMALEGTQVDSSHPPTHERIRFLARRAPTDGRVVIDADQVDDIDRELMPLEQRFTRDYIDGVHDRLYRR